MSEDTVRGWHCLVLLRRGHDVLGEEALSQVRLFSFACPITASRDLHDGVVDGKFLETGVFVQGMGTRIFDAWRSRLNGTDQQTRRDGTPFLQRDHGTLVNNVSQAQVTPPPPVGNPLLLLRSSLCKTSRETF